MSVVTFRRPLKQVYVSYFNEEGKKVDDGLEDFDTGEVVEVESHDDEEDADKVFLRLVPTAKDDLPSGFYKALNEVPRDAIEGL